jgi:hypothetical protein
MLNIVKLKLKSRYKNLGINEKTRILRPKEFSPAVRN